MIRTSTLHEPSAPTSAPSPSLDPLKPSDFRPDIQALRALAVVSVLLYHLWPEHLTGGFVGVDVFFVISGFLITLHLLREREKTGRIAIGRFWARRAARLLPASLIVLLTTAVLVVVIVPRSLWQQFLGDILASTFYVQNWNLMAASVDYLAADNAPSPEQHFWTLSVEEQFYVLLPILLISAIAVFRSLPWRRVVFATLAIAVVSSFGYGIWLTSNAPSEAYFSTFTRAWEFGVGALLAFAPAVASRAAASALSAVGIAAIALSVVLYEGGSTPFPGSAALLPVLGTAAAIAGGAGSFLTSAGRMAPVAFTGRISYAVYLWHWPLIVLVPFVTGTVLMAWQKFVIVAVTFLLAWLSTDYFENVVRSSPRLLAGRRPVVVGAFAAVGMLAVTSVAVSGFAVQRAEAAQVALIADDLAQSRPPCFGAGAMDPDRVGVCEGEEYGQLVPAFAEIEGDDANRSDCWSGGTDATLRICTLGPEKDFDKHVVALGDSHGNALLGVYEELAESLNWRVDVAGRGACWWTDQHLEHKPEQTPYCEKWRAAVNAYVAETEGVDAYLTTRFAGDATGDEADVEGLLSAWAHRPDSDTPVVAILDNPQMEGDPVRCVEEDPAAAAAAMTCALPRDEARGDPALEEAADRDGNASMIDMTDHYCTSTMCPAVLGGVIVYRDPHHLTATFASSLAPYLIERIVAAVG
ncbi:acyltransferase family protein [Microbacterium sp. JZ31]|uniref:acyltransferase family protein n=1 Tax=Microbacterium sp. JZ31 TaxID=1906274 RepID=UPI0021500F00|nr:acyltransferase family protein [Microbacterium sp. JZ31]